MKNIFHKEILVPLIARAKIITTTALQCVIMAVSATGNNFGVIRAVMGIVITDITVSRRSPMLTSLLDATLGLRSGLQVKCIKYVTD